MARTFPGQLSLPGRSKVSRGLQEGKEGLWPSLIDMPYQVGAKFGMAYREGLWHVAHICPTGEEQSLEVPTRRQARPVVCTFPDRSGLPGRPGPRRLSYQESLCPVARIPYLAYLVGQVYQGLGKVQAKGLVGILVPPGGRPPRTLLLAGRPCTGYRPSW